MFLTDANEAALLKSRFKVALLSEVLSSAISCFLLELLVVSFVLSSDPLLFSLGALLKFT